MRLPRLRIRTLMSLVAAMAIALGLGGRSYRLRTIADAHRLQQTAVIACTKSHCMRLNARGEDISPTWSQPKEDWHRALAAKYRDYANRPWLPVPPDPPEPK